MDIASMAVDDTEVQGLASMLEVELEYTDESGFKERLTVALGSRIATAHNASQAQTVAEISLVMEMGQFPE